MLSLFATLCIVTLVLTGLFLLVLVSPHQRKHACNRVLLALLSLNGLLILAGLAAQLQWFSIFAYPIPFFLSRAVFFLIPPLLYLYVAIFVDAHHPIRVYHLAPALLVFLALWVRFAFDATGAWIPASMAIAYFAGLSLSFVLYYMAAWRTLHRLRSNQQEKVPRHTWMYATLVTFGIHWGFSTASGVLGFTAQSAWVQHTESLSIFSLLIFCCMATYLGAQQLPALAHPYPSPKYAGSPLNNGNLKHTASTLLAFIVKEKPYLDPDLSSEKLAQQANLTQRQLSQVLNDGVGQPFFDLINGYRVEEAKRLLKHPAYGQHTVLEILYEAGFNSKSAFNRVFKASTGMTPTQFRKLHNKHKAV